MPLTAISQTQGEPGSGGSGRCDRWVKRQKDPTFSMTLLDPGSTEFEIPLARPPTPRVALI